jgi:hypothetical protein
MSDYLELAKKARERADKATPGPWHGDAHDGSVKYKMLGADDRVVYRINTITMGRRAGEVRGLL